MKIFISLFTLLLIVFSYRSFSSDLFQFSNPLFKGSGYPKGSASTTLSPDNQEVSVLFDQFFLEVPQYNGGNARNSFKMCDMLFSAIVPNNHKIKSLIVSIDFRGNTYIEKKAQALFRTQFISFKGPRGTNNRGQKLLDNQFQKETQSKK